MTKKPHVLVIANSAGMLARAAKSAGYSVLSIDAFGDLDTLEATVAHHQLPYRGDKVDGNELCTLIHQLTKKIELKRIIWGSGFENSAHVLMALATRYRLAGANPKALLMLASPSWMQTFVGLPGAIKLIAGTTSSQHPGGEIIKSGNSVGGQRVRRAGKERFLSHTEFRQEYFSGRSISAVCVADEKNARIIGWSEHFNIQPVERMPFRQSAVVAIGEPKKRNANLQTLLTAISAELGIFGIFGCDFIELEDGCLRLVDLNPRMTASTPLHIPIDEIITCHVDGSPPRRKPERVKAMAVLYADVPIRIAKALDWPAWVSDIPSEAGIYRDGVPLCTIWSDGFDTKEAKANLLRRRDEILDRISSSSQKN